MQEITNKKRARAKEKSLKSAFNARKTALRCLDSLAPVVHKNGARNVTKKRLHISAAAFNVYRNVPHAKKCQLKAHQINAICASSTRESTG